MNADAQAQMGETMGANIKNKAASPSEANESIFIKAIIEAHLRQFVSVIDLQEVLLIT